MSQRKKVTLLSLVICALVVGAIWLGGKSFAESQPTPAQGDGVRTPLERLNAKARAARTHDETAVRELVDESFNVVALNDGPAGMTDAIKERLTRAEMNWRRGAMRGVSDANVARTINHLADRFNAPEYAHTNRYEVRLLHTALLPYLPDFIGRDNSGAPSQRSVGSSINHERMSPLEAVFVTAMLLRQKQSNPFYQLTHDELVSRWKELHSKTKRDKAGKKEDAAAKEQEHARRRNAVAAAVDNGAAALSPAELLSLPADVLDDLGIEQ